MNNEHIRSKENELKNILIDIMGVFVCIGIPIMILAGVI